MHPHIRLRTLALVGVLAGVACGDSANNTPMGPSGSAGISATIDGQAWTAVSATAVRSGDIIGIGASDAAQVGIGIGFVDAGTGDYPIGNSPTNALVSSGGQTWTASAANGGSGTITVTTLTATRIAGTFFYTAPALTGNPTPATRVVTNGVFDLTF